jgi:hypothetical protein
METRQVTWFVWYGIMLMLFGSIYCGWEGVRRDDS